MISLFASLTSYYLITSSRADFPIDTVLFVILSFGTVLTMVWEYTVKQNNFRMSFTEYTKHKLMYCIFNINEVQYELKHKPKTTRLITKIPKFNI